MSSNTGIRKSSARERSVVTIFLGFFCYACTLAIGATAVSIVYSSTLGRVRAQTLVAIGCECTVTPVLDWWRETVFVGIVALAVGFLLIAGQTIIRFGRDADAHPSSTRIACVQVTSLTVFSAIVPLSVYAFFRTTSRYQSVIRPPRLLDIMAICIGLPVAGFLAAWPLRHSPFQLKLRRFAYLGTGVIAVIISFVVVTETQGGGVGSPNTWVHNDFLSYRLVPNGQFDEVEYMHCDLTSHCIAFGNTSAIDFYGNGVLDANRNYNIFPFAVETSNNGGTSWTPTVPPVNPPMITTGIFSTDCTSASDCIVIPDGPTRHYDLMSTRNGGHAWSYLSTEPKQQGLEPFAKLPVCVNTQECFVEIQLIGGTQEVAKASSYELVVTHDGGMTWEPSLELPPGGSLAGLICPDAQTCWGVQTVTPAHLNPRKPDLLINSLLTTTNGGESWSYVKAPSGLGTFESLSCTSSSDCWVVGTNGPPDISTFSVVNGSGSTFVAVTTNGGRSWREPSVPVDLIPGTVTGTSITCVDISHCWLLVDTLVNSYNPNQGSALSPGTALKSIESLVPSGNRVSYVISTTNSGYSWSISAVTTSPLEFAAYAWSLQCIDEVHCWILARAAESIPGIGAPGTSFVLRSSNGGASWLAEKFAKIPLAEVVNSFSRK